MKKEAKNIKWLIIGIILIILIGICIFVFLGRPSTFQISEDKVANLECKQKCIDSFNSGGTCKERVEADQKLGRELDIQNPVLACDAYIDFATKKCECDCKCGAIGQRFTLD
jgi:hypothetical protein